ncbi:hypothetical protein ACWD3I_47090 [Streptomyces sp. NPDC002817]|uniref:hypothetical protein n=1 Tax=Streptomyces sp. NPDC088357 TaxID=3154655 RepID=UPI003417ADAF
MVELTAAYTAVQADRGALARDFADRAEDTVRRLARHRHTDTRPLERLAVHCGLYRIEIHRRLGDLDAALAHPRRLDLRALGSTPVTPPRPSLSCAWSSSPHPARRADPRSAR